MKFTPTYISIISAITLSACGGGDSGNNATTNVSVIDGYLANAVVYAENDNNAYLSDGDYKIGVTDDNGVIAVPNQYMSKKLYVKVIAGVTSDADTGIVQTSYEMTAAAGSNVITPYTTLAATTADATLLQTIADNLGVEVSALTGDYVAKNSKLAHAYAKSLVNNYLSNSTIESLNGDTSDVTEITSNAITLGATDTSNYTDENWNNLQIASDGSVSDTAPTTYYLSQYISDNISSSAWNFESLNAATYAEDGADTVLFTPNTDITSGSVTFASTSGTYSVNDATNVATIHTTNPTETNYAKFVYQSPELAVLKNTKTKEALIVDEPSSTTYQFAAPSLAGDQTTYTGVAVDGITLNYLIDDSTTTKPAIAFASFKFTPDSDETSNTSGTAVDSIDGTTYSYQIIDGKLNLVEEMISATSLTVATTTSSIALNETLVIELVSKDANGIYLAKVTNGTGNVSYALLSTDNNILDALYSVLKE